MKNTFRKSIALLLSLSMVFSLFAGMSFVSAADLTGYEEAMSVEKLVEDELDAEAGKAYSIKTSEELFEFAEYVNSGRPTEGVTFYLKRDIELEDQEWNPMGTAEKMFKGTLDGCGFTITNMITLNTAYYKDAGLFAYLGGTIINLGIAGRSEGELNAGGFAAQAYAAKIINCWSSVRTKAENAGGLIGMGSDVQIINCANYAKVVSATACGGIVGKLTGKSIIDYCYYSYTSANTAYGTKDKECSVAAHRFASTPTVCWCDEQVSIGGTSSQDLRDLLDIWVGLSTDEVFYRSWVFDTGEACVSKAGGYFPTLRYPNYVNQEIPVYTATASMTTLYESNLNAESGCCYSIGSAKELGYLAEYVNRGGLTKNVTFFLTEHISIVTQDAHYKDFYTGEYWVPIGDTQNTAFRGVFDGQGFVIGELFLGEKNDYAGLFGYINDNDAVIKNVAVSGSISDCEYGGGIVSELVRGKIINSWFSGNVYADRAAGGICGVMDDGEITNCVYFGTASGKRLFGGVAGQVYSGGEMRYCYYLSDNPAACGDNQGTNYLCVDFRAVEGVYTLTRSVKINQDSTVRLLNALNDWVDSRAKVEAYRYWKTDKTPTSIAIVRGTHPTQIYFGDGSTVSREEETPADQLPNENPYDIIYPNTATMTELYESKQNVVAGGNYSISSGDEMSMLSKYVEEGYSTKDANFYLTTDIYLTTQGTDHAGAGFVPIGTGISIDFEITGTGSFRGDFDGCGFTVYGLYIVSDFLDFAGLFGRCKGSTIKNLGVCGDILGDDEVGGIVGRIEDGNIINCWSSVNIQCSTDLGGIAGHIVDTNIENCSCYGVLVTTLDEGEDSGGVFGESVGDCSVKNCYYLYVGADAVCNSMSKSTTIKDVYSFRYDITGDQSCTLEQAITIDDKTTDDLLTVLNAWVLMQNSDQYCTWHTASSIDEVPSTNGGYFPVLTNPSYDNSVGTDNYCGDYEGMETATMSALYSTRKDGISGGYYSISTTDDLKAFRMYVNEGYETRDITFFMKKDIDMSAVWSPGTDQCWTPVGTALNPFKGVFDGQGYTLKNLYINSSEDNQAFFGYITGLSAVVKNLGISGEVFTSGTCAAAICADFNFGTIENCWSSCSAEAISTAGGIIGTGNMGIVRNCCSYGLVVSTSSYGAIAAFPVGTQLNCCYYLYASCQQGYTTGSSPVATSVCYFNGTGASCILSDKVTINGIETKNAASAVKMYVDAHPEVNYCYWDVADSLEYYMMGALGFPVLISASNTKGGKDYKTEVAEFNGEKFYTVQKAVEKANDTEGGGTVTLLVNAVIQRSEKLTLDDDVDLNTASYSLIIKTAANVRYIQQLVGNYTVKEGGGIYIWDDTEAKYFPFMYSRKSADPSCDSTFYGNDSLCFVSRKINTGDPTSYDLEFTVGEFKVNSSSGSGNPHRIPPKSKLTIAEGATMTVITNARIRTYGGAEIYNYGTIKIGNATLDCNTGVFMKGIFEDSAGKVTLPYVYKENYTLRGWTDGETIYTAGTTIEVSEAKTLTAQWKIGSSGDPYPGDDAFSDPTEKVYDIPISILQSDGGRISPESTYVAKGDNLTIEVEAYSGYYVKNVMLDGVSIALDSEGKYVLPSINEAHEIVALFAKTANIEYYEWIGEYQYRQRFSDVKESDWYNRAVNEMCAAKYFFGTSAATFSPDNIMSREMVVTVLWRMAGSPVIPGEDCVFTDVPEDEYAYEAIRWAYSFGLVNGITETTFGYLEPITREQFATILFRFAQSYCGADISKYDSTNILGYTDVLKISYGMYQPFQWAVGAGIVLGIGDNLLDPLGTTSRAQAVAMFFRFCNRVLFQTMVIDV